MNTFKFNGMLPKTAPKACSKEQIFKEVKDVYADCLEDAGENYNKRNLNFCASGSLKPKDWRDCMLQVVPRGYNNFNVEAVYKQIKDLDIRLIPAREKGSVCVYILHHEKHTILKKIFKELGAYEMSSMKCKTGGKLRIWWD